MGGAPFFMLSISHFPLLAVCEAVGEAVFLNIFFSKQVNLTEKAAHETVFQKIASLVKLNCAKQS